MAWGYMRAQSGGGGLLCAMMALATSSNGWTGSGYADGVTFTYRGASLGNTNSLTCQKSGEYRILVRNAYSSTGYIRLYLNGTEMPNNSDAKVQINVDDVLSFKQSWSGTGNNLGCVVIEK